MKSVCKRLDSTRVWKFGLAFLACQSATVLRSSHGLGAPPASHTRFEGIMFRSVSVSFLLYRRNVLFCLRQACFFLSSMLRLFANC